MLQIWVLAASLFAQIALGIYVGFDWPIVVSVCALSLSLALNFWLAWKRAPK
jgi:hypothetical protein